MCCSLTAGYLHQSRAGRNGDLACGNPCLQDMRNTVVQATLDVYKKVTSSLLPTPTKSHYTFNLRDISRVMQVSSSGQGRAMLSMCLL